MATYLNPMSVFPEMEGKVQGATAGGLAYDREQDYKKLMQNELFMKELARQKEIIDFQNLQADQGNVALKRQGETATLQGKLPYLQEAAAGEQQTKIASDAFTRDVTKGPEARNADISGFLKKLDDDQVIKLGRTVDITKKLLPQANAMGPEQGSAWMRQQIEQYKKMGIEIDDFLANPATWKQWMEGMTNFDPAYQQRMAETSFKEGEQNKRNTENRKSQERIAELNRKAAIEAARVRSSGGQKAPKNEIELFIRDMDDARKAMEESGQDSDEFRTAVMRADASAEMAYTKSGARRRDEDTITNTPSTAGWPLEKKQAELDKLKRAWIQSVRGGRVGGNSGQPAPQPNQGQAKPDPLGLR